MGNVFIRSMSFTDANIEYYEFALDSADASGAHNSSVTSLNWPTFLIGGKQPLENIAAIKIVEVQIPFSYYVIDSTRNTFWVAEGNGSTPVQRLITIPVGNYTATTFGTALALALTTGASGGATYTVTYSVLTGLYTFTAAGGTTVSIGFTFGFTPFLGAPFPIPFDNSPMLMMGFNTNQAGGSGLTIVSNAVALVTGPDYLYVNSATLGPLTNLFLPSGASLLGGGNAGPQIAKIPVNCQPGGVIFWQDPTPDRWFSLDNLFSLTRLGLYLSLGNFGTKPLDLNGRGFVGWAKYRFEFLGKVGHADSGKDK